MHDTAVGQLDLAGLADSSDIVGIKQRIVLWDKPGQDTDNSHQTGSRPGSAPGQPGCLRHCGPIDGRIGLGQIAHLVPDQQQLQIAGFPIQIFRLPALELRQQIGVVRPLAQATKPFARFDMIFLTLTISDTGFLFTHPTTHSLHIRP
ncbi:hypothetical protein D3C84_776160 [compost metagenome]